MIIEKRKNGPFRRIRSLFSRLEKPKKMTTAGIAAVAGAFGLMLQAVCLLKNVKCAGNYTWTTLAAGGKRGNSEWEKRPCYIFAARAGKKE